jgi:hypothetical protein
MGVVLSRRGQDGRSGHTLKGSQSPGEAEAVRLTTSAAAGARKPSRAGLQGKAEEGSPNQ